MTWVTVSTKRDDARCKACSSYLCGANSWNWYVCLQCDCALLVAATHLTACTYSLLYSGLAAAQVELGFEQADYAVREGRNGEFFLQTYIGSPINDVVLRLIPMTVSGFQNYRSNNPTRIFAQSILDDVAAISNPAECELKANTKPLNG